MAMTSGWVRGAEGRRSARRRDRTKASRAARASLPAGGLLSLALWVWVSAAGTLPAAEPLAKHCLWRVEGSNTVYVLGSIHVFKRQDYPLPAPIESAFSNAAVVVFETDLGGLQSPKIQQELLRQASLPAGETLRQVLPGPLYTNFNRHVAGTGLPAETLDHFKPAMAAMTLEVLAFVRLGFDPNDGIDLHFFKRAGEEGKKVEWLESVDFQIRLITDIPPAQGKDLLKATLADLDKVKSTGSDLVRAWQTGDTGELDKLVNYGLRDAAKLRERMLTERNRRWVPRIEALRHQPGPALVIVGAGHLVGPDGLIALLRQAGLKVVQE